MGIWMDMGFVTEHSYLDASENVVYGGNKSNNGDIYNQ